ncbi:MAG: carboxylase [Spirochaetae bacterium HGW-Spirochaetae-9]|nr:MAG: carboxylase [Spirochaetae bacterium HGW-Spirochaetae-9]
MNKQLKIRDLTLRDGQQSQFATRMNQAQVDKVLPDYRKANFYAMEVWGGAVPDSVMRYLNESPWERLESIKSGIGNSSKLTALSRGRNLFGYNPYPDSVIEGFCSNAVKSGIDIMRIFDALNDIENMKSSIRFVKEAGGMADCAVCYTVDPKFSGMERFKALLSGKSLPNNIFNIDYFVKKAKALEAVGADMITIKDMAGLIDPAMSAKLIKALKNEIGIPVDLHTHCTPGFGVASLLAAMVNGVDIVDTAILSFSGGPAAPAYEIIRIFADKLGMDTGVDNAAVARIDGALRFIRAELSKFDQYKRLPPQMDLSKDHLPAELNSLFDDALELTVGGKLTKALERCRQIEAAFNYPEPDAIVQTAQIPGGMYTNMMAQLKEAKLEQHLSEVLRVVPIVRLDAGVPPLVTPTSQIVGVQAVNYVVSKIKGEDVYANVSKNFAELVKGSYGKTPWPVNPDFRFKICGIKEEIPYDTSNYAKQPNPTLAEAGGHPLAVDEKEELLLELFPSVAEKFLKGQRIAEWEKLHGPAGARKESEPSEKAAAAGAAGESVAETPDPAGIQYFTAPAFASEAAPLPPGYAVEDGHDAEYWQFAVENAE